MLVQVLLSQRGRKQWRKRPAGPAGESTHQLFSRAAENEQGRQHEAAVKKCLRAGQALPGARAALGITPPVPTTPGKVCLRAQPQLGFPLHWFYRDVKR